MNRRNSTFRHFQGIPETGAERMNHKIEQDRLARLAREEEAQNAQQHIDALRWSRRARPDYNETGAERMNRRYNQDQLARAEEAQMQEDQRNAVNAYNRERSARPDYNETGAERRDRQLAEQRAAREEAIRLSREEEAQMQEDQRNALNPSLGARIKSNLSGELYKIKKDRIGDVEIDSTYDKMEDYVENRFNEISSQIAPGSMTDEEIYAQATREFVQSNPDFFNNLSNAESKEFMNNLTYTPEDIHNNMLTTEEAALKSGMASGLNQISVDKTLATKLGLSEYGAKMINAGIIGALAAAGITLGTLLSVGFGGKGVFKRAALGERAQRRAAQGYRKQGKDDMAAKMIAKADRHAQRKIEKAIAAGDTDKANYIKSRLGTDKSNFSFNQLVKRLNYIQFSINYTR